MSYKHIKSVTATPKFTVEKGRKFRYRLEVTKLDAPVSGKTVCLVMQNPSRADENEADRSVQFMEQLVFKMKHPLLKQVRRLIVVNQFALVQTNGFQGNNEDIGKDNDKEIEKALRESDIVILGWGSSNKFDLRKCVVFSLLKGMPRKKIYKTRIHPSRASHNDVDLIQPFTW
jgi:hypothetical protein